MAGRRKERMMREKGETWKSHQELSEDKKKKEEENQCSIFLLCLVSFSLHGPSPQGKAGKSGMQRGGEWERAKEINDSHPQEQWTLDKSKHTWYYDRTYLSNTMSTIILCLYVKKSHICRFNNVSVILPYLSTPDLIFWVTSLFYFQMENFAKWESHNSTP